MNANVYRLAYLEALGVSNDYRWEIAEKNGIVRFSISSRIEFFNNDEWDKVASEEEKKQAAVLENEWKKAWRAYQNALREEKRLVRK